MSVEAQFEAFFEDNIINAFTEKKNRYAYAIWDRLMVRTPVDTGTLRYNWTMVFGGVSGSVNNPYPESRKKNYYPRPHRPYLKDAKSSVYIYNNSLNQSKTNEYLGHVNTGSTSPRNVDFVESAIWEAQTIMVK